MNYWKYSPPFLAHSIPRHSKRHSLCWRELERLFFHRTLQSRSKTEQKMLTTPGIFIWFWYVVYRGGKGEIKWKLTSHSKSLVIPQLFLAVYFDSWKVPYHDMNLNNHVSIAITAYFSKWISSQANTDLTAWMHMITRRIVYGIVVILANAW